MHSTHEYEHATIAAPDRYAALLLAVILGTSAVDFVMAYMEAMPISAFLPAVTAAIFTVGPSSKGFVRSRAPWILFPLPFRPYVTAFKGGLWIIGCESDTHTLGHPSSQRIHIEGDLLVQNGDTVLHVACDGGLVKVVELLIKTQADLNGTNKNGDTGLHVACDGGHVKIVELLIKNQADLNVTNGKDYEIVSPECGELRILRYNSGRHDSTSMIFGRHITAVKAEVKYKFWLRGGSVRHNGDTALHVACRGGNVKVVELLIKNQADLNMTNKNGDTGLHVACSWGHNGVVELLIKNQANLDVTNKTRVRFRAVPGTCLDMSPDVVPLGKALYTNFLTPPRCEWVPNFGWGKPY
ncbi:hypothetical protein Bbelb_331550 [Branchiostoma belcheri]|nr:hypothetical protein Bbelb_331550 [Branchiostoma belcheri]